VTDELSHGKEVEFINLVILPDKGSDKAKVQTRSLVGSKLAEGIGDTDETAKAPAVHLSDGLPPIPAKIAAKILNSKFVEMADLLPEAWSARKGDESSGRKGAKAKKKLEDIHVGYCNSAMRYTWE
jgi:hypothetical protein